MNGIMALSQCTRTKIQLRNPCNIPDFPEGDVDIAIGTPKYYLQVLLVGVEYGTYTFSLLTKKDLNLDVKMPLLDEVSANSSSSCPDEAISEEECQQPRRVEWHKDINEVIEFLQNSQPRDDPPEPAEINADKKKIFCVKNTRNYDQWKSGKKMHYWDACGAWNKPSMKHYIFALDNNGENISNMNSLTYDNEKKKIVRVAKRGEKAKAVPLKYYERMFVLRRIYSKILPGTDSKNTLVRRIQMFLHTPEKYQELLGKASWEYQGTFSSLKPSGKSKQVR